MSFEKLREIFLEEDYEVDLLINNAALADGDLTINFKMARGSDDILEEEWMLRALEHRESRITLGYASGISLADDHPLLWKFCDYQCELYFSGKCAEPDTVIVDLMKIDLEVFRNYQPFGTYLNGNIFKLMNSGNGLMARGPEKLLVKYAEILDKHNLVYSMINKRPAVYWDGKEFIQEKPGYKILLFTNDHGYIVAKGFELDRK